MEGHCSTGGGNRGAYDEVITVSMGECEQPVVGMKSCFDAEGEQGESFGACRWAEFL